MANRGRGPKAFARCLALLCGTLFAAVPLAASAAESDAGPDSVRLEIGPPLAQFWTPSQIIKAAQASSRHYDVVQECAGAPVAQFAALSWPQQIAGLDTPAWVSGADGGVTVAPYQQSPEVIELIAKGDEVFATKKFAEATAFYRKALKLSPHDYLALLFLGDCAYQQGFLPDALELYLQAEAANPADPRSFFFQASAFTALGHFEEARNAYAEALIRSWRRKTLRTAITSRSEKLNVMLQDDLFHPLALARPKGDAVEVCLAGAAPHWLAYGMCKALWLGEEKHRLEMTGSADHHFTSAEEKECLAALLGTYGSKRREGKVPAEAELDRLLKILDAGFINEFIILELATRVFPQAPLFLPEAGRPKLKAYVREFVLGPKTPAEDAGSH